MTKEIRIKLYEDDFQCLVSGGILTLQDKKNNQEIKICLADIGFYRMENCIGKVENGEISPYSHLTKELE